MKQRKHISGETKSIILRELLENQTPISQLSEQYKINPNDIHRWKKQLFENAAQILGRMFDAKKKIRTSFH